MADLANEAAESMRRLLEGSMAPLLNRAAFPSSGRSLEPGQVVEVLANYLTERRRARIEAVLAGRTYTVVPVVEGVVNTGNVSAVQVQSASSCISDETPSRSLPKINAVF